jgi:hypothetical protein
VKTTEDRDDLRDRNRRGKNCSKCGGTCERLTGLDDDAHFPSVVYKRCTACGWEIAMKGQRP